MKKTSTDSAAPATFDEYVDLNTHQDDLAQIGVNPVEWNTDNFLDDRKYMNRAREILRTNPNISPVDAEMKIIAIRAAIRKCAITDVEKRETYNTELHAYKLLKDWLMNNYRGNKKMKNISENKNMKKNTVKLNESTLRKMVAESVKKVLKEGYYDPDFRGPNDTDRLAGDILDFIDKNKEKYQNANQYEAVKQVLDSVTPRTYYGTEGYPDGGHTFGY